MSTLNINTLNKIIKENFNQNIGSFNTFIETGTFLGETTISLEEFFEKVHTIELSEKYFNMFDERKKNLEKFKITNHLGDTVRVLPSILNNLNESDSSIFWLDGHWSSGDTAKGEKDCPLKEECEIIDSLYKSTIAVILIDDYRLFNTKKNEDWLDITEDKLEKCFTNFTVTKKIIFNDILAFLIQKNINIK
jgi:hypothetical protein